VSLAETVLRASPAAGHAALRHRTEDEIVSAGGSRRSPKQFQPRLAVQHSLDTAATWTPCAARLDGATVLQRRRPGADDYFICGRSR